MRATISKFEDDIIGIHAKYYQSLQMTDIYILSQFKLCRFKLTNQVA